MIFERIKSWLCEPGMLKTPVMAVAGWATWANVKGVLEAVVLIGTVIIVSLHVITAFVRRLCRRRFIGSCNKCALQGSFWCPKGLGKDDE